MFPAPTPAPRNKHLSGVEIDISDDDDVPTIQQRIQQLQPENGGGDADASNGHKPAPRKRRPNSQAFQMFESTGMIISMVSVLLTLNVLVATIDAQWEGMGDVGSTRYVRAGVIISHTGTVTEIQTQRDSNPVLTSASQQVAGMRFSSH